MITGIDCGGGMAKGSTTISGGTRSFLLTTRISVTTTVNQRRANSDGFLWLTLHKDDNVR